ncbi:hypothetical protein [Mediterranea sp. An20]|uniref:hypothetical protein n=1 Tax=Mediterranea sp. An20 TaxID=1965586 RepID=UPI00112199F2|nr:hypothetical protein [Mediterranea sp. An20]
MKKWTYLAVAGMLLGSAPVFTGCVDTDEPWGVEQLRGAKAELLKAKAAVEQARVALVQAEADLKAAKAETERANAALQEEMARKQQIENDMQEAKNELELQELQALLDQTLARIEIEKEEAALAFEAEKANLQASAAQAQFAYEMALKQIEIAKALGISDLDQATLTALQQAVTDAYVTLYGDAVQQSNGNYGLTGQLRDAKKKLYDAQMNKLEGYDTDKDGNKTTNTLWIPTLEADVEVKKALLMAAESALEDLQALADKDIAGTDWAAEIDALQEEIATLKAEVEEKEAELVRQKATPEYLALYQAVNGVYSDYEPDGITPATGATVVKNGTAGVLQEKNQALAKAATDKKSFNIAAYKSTMEVTQVMSDAVANQIPVGAISINGAQNFSWGNNGDKSKTPADAQTILSQYENYLNILKTVVWVDDNDIAQAEAILKQAQEAADAAKKKYDEAYADWEEVKNIIANETDYQVDITDFKKVTDAYNTAYSALQTAITNWNEGLQAAYDEAYDELYEAEVISIKAEALGYQGTAISQITAIDGFDEGAVVASWNTYSSANRTEANLNNLIAMNCTGYTSGNTEVTAAEIQAQVQSVLTAYVTQETSALDWADTQKQIEDDAKDAADSFDTTTEGAALMKAVRDAAGKVGEAYGKIDPAMDAYIAMAKTFAQVTDDEVFNIDYLVSALDKDGKPTTVNEANWYADGTGDNVIGHTAAKIVINNSDITPTELTTATKTTFSEALYQTALDAVSQAAFGEDNRYAPVDIDKAQGGAAKAYQDALDYVAQQEATISANEDLKALQTELNTTYTGIKTDLAAQYDKVFASEVAAIDEAKKADDAARAALAEADAQFIDLNIEIGELNAELAGKESVSEKLTDLVDTYLQEAGAVDENGSYVTYDPETFAVKMQEAVAVQQKAVATAEQNVKSAEVALQKAQAGAFDGVAYHTMVVEILQAQYDAAMEAYNKAQEDLAKALEIMSTTSGEQPAE